MELKQYQRLMAGKVDGWPGVAARKARHEEAEGAVKWARSQEALKATVGKSKQANLVVKDSIGGITEQRESARDYHKLVATGAVARLRVHDAGDHKSHFFWCVEFSSALPAAFCELADEVFVTAPDDVRLNVSQSEALGTDLFDQVRETVIVNVALAVGGGVEVDPVVMPFRSGFASAMVRRCVVTSQRCLVKMRGRMNSLYLAASFAPRMEQAASQIHDSRPRLVI
jgi:hypothetical protein